MVGAPKLIGGFPAPVRLRLPADPRFRDIAAEATGRLAAQLGYAAAEADGIGESLAREAAGLVASAGENGTGAALEIEFHAGGGRFEIRLRCLNRSLSLVHPLPPPEVM